MLFIYDSLRKEPVGRLELAQKAGLRLRLSIFVFQDGP